MVPVWAQLMLLLTCAYLMGYAYRLVLKKKVLNNEEK